MATIRVTASLEDIFGNALASSSFGALNVQLCGYGSQIPRISGTAMLAGLLQTEANAVAGVVTFSVYGNDVILPAGTYYTVQAVDAADNVIQTNAYQFTGSAAVDLSTLATYTPDGLTPVTPVVTGPAVGVVNVASSASVGFNGALGNIFRLLLAGNVTSSSTVNLVPGQLYVFEILEPQSGPTYSFAWPANLPIAPPIETANGWQSSLGAVCLADGSLLPVVPVSYLPSYVYPLPAAGTPSVGPTTGVVTVAQSSTPLFNGATGNVFQLLLSQNATSSMTANLLAGQLYVFNLEQPASGPTYSFAWPANLPIAAPIAMGNGRQTTVIAAFLNDGTLLPIGAVLYL